MAPMMVMTSATTAAKIGRSMKKRLILMGFAVPASRGCAAPCIIPGPCRRLCRPAPRRAAGASRLGVTLMPGRARCRPLMITHSSADDAFAHHAQALVQRAELDVAARRRRRPRRPHRRTCWSGRCRWPRRGAAPPRKAPLPVTRTRANRPGENSPAGVGHHGAGAQRAGALVEPVVEKVQPRLVREAALVGERDLDRRAEIGGPRAHAALGQPLVLDVVVLADVEVDVDRVLADDGRQQRGAADRRRR